MNSKCIILGDKELNTVLKYGLNKKEFLLYFLLTPNLKHKISICYLPESILEDMEFVKQLINFMKNNGIKVGISINTVLVKTNLDYNMNKLLMIKSYINNFEIDGIHIRTPFGERDNRRSPRMEEYVMQTTYNWINVCLVLEYLKVQNVDFLCEIDLKLKEGSSEDYYIHMRQILWDGIEIIKKFGLKLKDTTLMISPFYPKIKGMRSVDIKNVANTTLRCLLECCIKTDVEIILKNGDMGFGTYREYLRYIEMYNKENKLVLNYEICKEIIIEYVKIWMGKKENLIEAQKRFNNLLVNYLAPEPLRLE